MPPTFPSHQGLIAPLWRRWPHLFDMPALCVGAAMPDVIDGFGIFYRAHLGQAIGHSFVGLFLLCLPGGLLLWYGLHWAAARVPASRRVGFVRRAWNQGVTAIRAARPSGPFSIYWRRVMGSLFVGGASHLFFDALTHGHSPWFYPWRNDISLYPEWWHIAWMRFPLPLYEHPYPVGPHLLLWILFGLLGACWLFLPVLRDTHDKQEKEHGAIDSE